MIAAAACASTGVKIDLPPSVSAEQAYNRGVKYLDDDSYPEATEAFKEVITK
jgi:hypothetical protein